MVWIANAILVIGGLYLIAMLATGGEDLDLGQRWPRFGGFFLVLLPLCWAAVARLTMASRDAGLEGFLVTFFARRGMPPRVAPATLRSSLATGAFLGAGFGFVVAIADVVRVVASSSRPGPSPSRVFAIAAIDLLVGIVALALIGLLVGALVLWRWPERRVDVGRRITMGLILLVPLVVPLAPTIGVDQRAPSTLLSVTLAILIAALLVFLVLPAAITRARSHQWGLAAASACGVALILLLVLVGTFGPVPFGGSETADGRLNVLLVSISGLRRDFVGSYTQGVFPTAHLDGLAGRGARFLDVVTPSARHVEGAQALLTGRYPTRRPEFDDQSPSLPDLLSAHGYRTAAFVSCPCVNREALRLSGAFETYNDVATLTTWLRRTTFARFVVLDAASDEAQRPEEETAAAFRQWIVDGGRGPWFAWVEFAGPTRPRPLKDDIVVSLPSVWREREQPAVQRLPSWVGPRDAHAAALEWWQGYAQTVLRADDTLGTLVATLAARGELHRTIIVVVADHGTPLGEQGRWLDPSVSTDEAVIGVPWVIAGPGVGAQISVPGPCSLVDVVPTLLGLLDLGGGPSPRDEWEGEDLSRFLRGATAIRRSANSGPVFSRAATGGRPGELVDLVRFGPYKLLHPPGGPDQLLILDPVDGAQPVHDELVGPQMRRELADLLAAHRMQHDEP